MIRDNSVAMNQAARVITKFGTQERLADALGCRQSVIAGWKRRGFIPAPQQSRVLDAARRLKIALTPDDFFDPPSARESSRAAAA